MANMARRGVHRCLVIFILFITMVLILYDNNHQSSFLLDNSIFSPKFTSCSSSLNLPDYYYIELMNHPWTLSSSYSLSSFLDLHPLSHQKAWDASSVRIGINNNRSHSDRHTLSEIVMGTRSYYPTPHNIIDIPMKDIMRELQPGDHTIKLIISSENEKSIILCLLLFKNETQNSQLFLTSIGANNTDVNGGSITSSKNRTYDETDSFWQWDIGNVIAGISVVVVACVIMCISVGLLRRLVTKYDTVRVRIVKNDKEKVNNRNDSECVNENEQTGLIITRS